MLVPLIFQRAPYLTAALLTLSQPCLFSSRGAGGGGFPQPPAQRGCRAGLGDTEVSPSGTGAGSPAPARDARHLPPCSRAQPWSCKSLGPPRHQAAVSDRRCALLPFLCRTLCTDRHIAHRHVTRRAPAHRTPRRHPPHPTELFISRRACLAASSSISKHQAN